MSDEERHKTLRSYRLRTGAVFAAARELVLAVMASPSNLLLWYDDTFWIDRERWLIIPTSLFPTLPSESTLRDDGEGGEINELLVVFGGESRYVDSSELLRVIGVILAGRAKGSLWRITGAHLLNLCVVQPLVNPPFGPLFWLALAEDEIRQDDNLYTTLSPMMYDMSLYPEHVPDDGAIRRAQGQFLQRLTSGRVGGDAESYSADDWLRLCTWQLYAVNPLMNRMFGSIWSYTTRAKSDGSGSY